MHWVNPSGAGARTAAGSFNSNSAGFCLQRSDVPAGEDRAVRNTLQPTITIDINGASPVVQQSSEDMSSVRQWVSETVLADGRVLATGGSAVDNQMTGVNNTAAVGTNPGPQRYLDASGRPACGHAFTTRSHFCCRTPRCWSEAGGAPGPLVNKHVEIYRPAYLYDASGNLAHRDRSCRTHRTSLLLGQTFSFGVGFGRYPPA